MPPMKTDTDFRKQRFWRSLEELNDSPEFQRFAAYEFPDEFTGEGVSRREFLILMGASLALAGLVGCRWPEEKATPFAHRAEGDKPGQKQFFATALEVAGVAGGLLVTCVDGRPIKIEGNPLHPINQGAADLRAQAAILELYDPDRSRFVMHRNRRSNWDEFTTTTAKALRQLRARRGQGLYVLSEATSSVTTRAQKNALLQKYPMAQWIEFEAVGRAGEREGARLAFGRHLRTDLNLTSAKRIVSLDADFLFAHPASLKYARDFFAMRQPNLDEINRLYVIETAVTNTGAMADHRFAVKPSEMPLITAGLLAAVIRRMEAADGHADEDALAAAGKAAARYPFVETIAADLALHRGESVVVAGRRQPPSVHAAVHLINSMLGNLGRTVLCLEANEDVSPIDYEALIRLAADAEQNKVKALIILGGNPVYSAPPDTNLQQIISKADLSVHLSLYQDETSQTCQWHIPRAHPLESWADARAWDGTISIAQPMIAPLYDGKTVNELLHYIVHGDDAKAHDLVRDAFRNYGNGLDDDEKWKRALHDGLIEGSGFARVEPMVNRNEVIKSLYELISLPHPAGGGFELVTVEDAKVFDGRFANNAWLQELPDPITKIVWDNAAAMNPDDVHRLGLNNGDVVNLTNGSRSVTAPVYVMPGLAPGVVIAPLGYGRTAGGRVLKGVGFNASTLLSVHNPLPFTPADLRKTGRTHVLASTQDHHAIDSLGRREREKRSFSLIRVASHEEFRTNPSCVAHLDRHAPEGELWNPPLKREGHRWAMVIDLNRCNGCNACVVACQAENNIAVVGKKQVLNGREMNWLRVDRYFRGEPRSAQIAFQPIPCMQCENAPCEQVCPVAATVHSAEGLNDMVYNRCIGTRYCSNNCPFKVRRFNYFNYHKQLDAVQRMRFNPEVTVRSRGVMEKCTYCIQRIQNTRIEARNKGIALRADSIKTACQQTCPTNAIHFGDLNEESSFVAQLFHDPRCYELLSELNLKTRTRYLARIINPNPELEESTTNHDTAGS